jgi:hypothetical protein
MLASWENQSLWKYLWIDGGAGDWIFSGLMRGSLVIGHDGSYMPHLANNVCACVVVIYCSHMSQYADVTWVEKSTKKASTNYRTEILGGCSTKLIIKAAITGRNVLAHDTLTVGCDNMGVVRHGNSPQCPILEKQPTIRCSTVLQRPHGILQNQRTDATCLWTCRQVSVRGRDVTSTVGKLPGRQTGNGGTHCCSESK